MPSDEIELRRPRRPMPGPGTARTGTAHPGTARPGALATTSPGPLEVWAGLDPTGLAPRLVRVARLVPGVATFEERVVVPFERRLLDVVAARIRELPPERPAEPARRPQPRPQQRLTALIEDALDQTPSDGRDELYAAALDRLVPDEVRILAVLADGASYPLVTVSAGRGRDVTTLLANASTVGRAAEVVLPERTPVYVDNLIALGLARIGPEDGDLRSGYETLLGDPQVHSARADGDRFRRFGRARVARRSLRISDFGRELWAACRPSRGSGHRYTVRP